MRVKSGAIILLYRKTASTELDIGVGYDMYTQFFDLKAETTIEPRAPLPPYTNTREAAMLQETRRRELERDYIIPRARLLSNRVQSSSACARVRGRRG